MSVGDAALTSAELCAGAGGAALGLERAGFSHVLLGEIDADACATLRLNRPGWKVDQGDIRQLDGRQLDGIDLLSGGCPCSPFTSAGRQLGESDSRDMFPEALRLVAAARPRAVLLENVPGLLASKFAAYRELITGQLEALGYQWVWQILQASDYGVAQLRPRAVLVAAAAAVMAAFRWPARIENAPSVGQVLAVSMASRGWEGAFTWAAAADGIAPTLAGGSRLHGGPDLGPTRAKREWRDRLGVNGFGLADQVPGPGEFGRPATAAELHQGTVGMPKLTTGQAALLQGFPPEWLFSGTKTARWRQVGNAFPPPVAEAVGRSIASALQEAMPS
jgi:DNA (cytosine-5)-methyltransferase 1